MAYGQNSNIAIGFQDTYGTATTDSGTLVGSLYFLPHLSDGVKLEIGEIVDEAMRGIFDEGDSYEGPKSAGGDFDTTAQAISLGVMCRAFFGPPVTVTSGGVYEHTFTPRTSDFSEKCAGDPTMYYRYLETGSAEVFYDLNASMLELGITNGELLRSKITFVGGSHLQIAALVADYPVGRKFAWDVASVSIAGVGRDEQMDLTITFDDQLTASHTLNNSKFPSRIKRSGMRTVAVAGTLKFDNQDEYQQFIAQSERELIVNFKGGTEIQSGYYEEIKITCPAMRYVDIPVQAGGPGEIEVSISAKGKYHTGSATSAQVVVVNTQASY